MSKDYPKEWYGEKGGIFDADYLQEYTEVLTDERTTKDVDFLERELQLNPGMSILDLGCGHGRHSIELAKRGYKVTGLDLNSFFLHKAKEAAQAAGVDVKWVKSDMREIPLENKFDVVANLFTAFGYFESEAEDQKVINQAAKAMKPGGRFMVDVVNVVRIMRVFQEHDGRELSDGTVLITERHFNLETSRNEERRLRINPDGTRKDRKLSLRMYYLHELIAMCQQAGLTYERAFGENDSSDYSFNSMRCIVVAKK